MLLEMNSLIVERLKAIERNYEVRVLLAVESGSRAWGFASKDSDYDVRFIYIHPRDWYLQLSLGRDVIEEMDQEHDFDLVGWDLQKALTLMAKGNAMFVEWFGSPIVYSCEQPFFDEIVSLKDLYFNKLHCMYHYFRMAINHDEHYMQKRGCELKRFMYYTRGLLAAKWAWERNGYPPVPYRELVEAEVDDLQIKEGLMELVRLKAESREHNNRLVDAALVEWFAVLQQRIKEALSTMNDEKKPDKAVLDRFFRKTLDEAGDNLLPTNGPTAVVFVGIQASGKSTFYHEKLEPLGFRHISMDVLHNRRREEAWIRRCVANGQNFVIDNTNPTLADRRRYLDMLEGSGYAVQCYFFQSRVGDCLRRNRLRGMTVPDKAITSTSNKLQLPTRAEGFQQIYFVKMEPPHFDTSIYKEEP